jgi:hypothetical protein
MTEPDKEPKLRIVDEEERPSEEVVRLSNAGEKYEPVARLELPPEPEKAERIESVTRDSFDGRTQEPGVESIMGGQEIQAGVEKNWGEGEAAKKIVPYGWFVAIAALVAGAIFMSYRSIENGKEKVAVIEQKIETTREENEIRSKDAGTLVSRIEQETKDYLAAATIEEMLPHVRQPERVRPLMESWYKWHPLKPTVFKNMGEFGGVNLKGLPFWRIKAVVDTGDIHDLIVEQLSDTTAKIDWEMDVYYQPTDWDRFVKDRSSEQAWDFRVLATPDSFFSHEFPDDGHWACFQLMTAGGDYVFGYAPADSQLTKILRGMARSSPDRSTPVILRLHRPLGIKSPRGVLIDSLVAPSWVIIGDEKELAVDVPAHR